MNQFPLPLTLPALYAEDNFFVSDCNREAFEMIARWPNWPSHALVLYGPKASGKTHLGHIWSARAHGATSLHEKNRHLWIDDLDTQRDERALLHAFNYTREQGKTLLVTSALPAGELPFTLPDLCSRLRAVPSVALREPDDAALCGVLRKQFADRQLKVEDEVITYLASRIERSFAAAARMVSQLDHAALSEHKNITVPLARRVLGC